MQGRDRPVVDDRLTHRRFSCAVEPAAEAHKPSVMETPRPLLAPVPPLPGPMCARPCRCHHGTHVEPRQHPHRPTSRGAARIQLVAASTVHNGLRQ
jgi:hypothetical protein